MLDCRGGHFRSNQFRYLALCWKSVCLVCTLRVNRLLLRDRTCVVTHSIAGEANAPQLCLVDTGGGSLHCAAYARL